MAKILIVHSNPNFLNECCACLSRSHTVETVDSISSAMDMLKQSEQPDLDRSTFSIIVCAVHMEEDRLSVFDLLKWARGNPPLQDTPFFLLCTHQSEMAKYMVDAIRQAGSSLGASSYLTMEGFDADYLVSEVERHLPVELRSGLWGQKSEKKEVNGN